MIADVTRQILSIRFVVGFDLASTYMVTFADHSTMRVKCRTGSHDINTGEAYRAQVRSYIGTVVRDDRNEFPPDNVVAALSAGAFGTCAVSHPLVAAKVGDGGFAVYREHRQHDPIEVHSGTWSCPVYEAAFKAWWQGLRAA